MNHAKKVKMFFSLDKRSLLLLLEAYLWLGWARIRLLYRPFSRVAPSLGDAMQETPSVPSLPAEKAVLIDISNAISTISHHTFWESKCLVKAIAAMNMLARRRIASTLYLGTAKDETGNMIAHAWLRSGLFYVTGKEGMEKFTVVGKFAKRIRSNR